jgi:hypothetical protein
VLGGVLIASGTAGFGALLLLGGLFVALGALGMRGTIGWSMLESQQRQREREALRIQQALRREISRRERVLAETDSRGR